MKRKNSDYFLHSYSHVDIFLRKDQIQQIESYADGTICVKFIGGSSRLMGPFESSEVGHVLDHLMN